MKRVAMPARKVYFNGEFVAEQEARVSIFDSALMFGDMAFEMTRTYGQQPFRLREHLERLYASLRLMEIDCGLTLEEMESATLDTLAQNLPSEAEDVDWQIMHDVSRGPLPVYRTAFPEGLRPTVLINCWPLITHMGGFAERYAEGVDVIIPAQIAVPAHLVDPKAKTRSRLHYQMAVLQGARADGAWPVMMDPDGFLAEGPGWNIFLVKDRVIYTPEPRNILLGVSRGTIFDLAREQGLDICETNLGRYEALQADEIFCTATTYGLVHVASFEGQAVGDGTAGPVFHELMQAWKALVGVDFVAQAEDYARRLPQWLADEEQSIQQLKQEA
jgi:branched-chain amino acid aminotransferase